MPRAPRRSARHSRVAVNEVLKYLNLDGNEIGYEGAKALASALRVNGVLTELNLAASTTRAPWHWPPLCPSRGC